jgi:hypothetical protein
VTVSAATDFETASFKRHFADDVAELTWKAEEWRVALVDEIGEL